MATGGGTATADWDSMVSSLSEDRLLLMEASHRAANEVAAALAALHLVRSASGSKPRWRLLNSAIERLEGFGAVVRILAGPVAGEVDLSSELERLCVGLGAARRDVGECRMVLDLDRVRTDAATGRRVLMVAAELVANAIRYALEGREGCLTVVLRSDERDVMVSVIDDGPGIGGFAGPGGTGMGGPIVRELVRRAGGGIECDTGPAGTTFYVAIPHRGTGR